MLTILTLKQIGFSLVNQNLEYTFLIGILEIISFISCFKSITFPKYLILQYILKPS